MANSLILQVRGMSCAGCADKIREALTKVPGVSSAEVNFLTGRALVQFRDGRVEQEQLDEAVKAGTFPATEESYS